MGPLMAGVTWEATINFHSLNNKVRGSSSFIKLDKKTNDDDSIQRKKDMELVY